MKRPNNGTSGDLFHRKEQNVVRLGIYFIETAEINYGWPFISLKTP